MTETIFLVLVRYKNYSPAFEETDPNGASEADIVKNIARNRYIGRVEKVLAINEAEGTCRNVTKDIAVKVADHIVADQHRFGMEPIERSVLEFLENNGGIYLANALQAAE